MTSPSVPDPLRAELLGDPSLFPQKLDLARERVLFIRMSRQDYEAASFLDDRILTPTTKGQWLRFTHLDRLLAGARPQVPLGFIFHAGHVGSTLLSRLIEAAGGVLALREPLPLQTLAAAADALEDAAPSVSAERFEALARGQLLLWRRAYPDTRFTLVKATSAAARLGPRLLALEPEARAIHLNLRPEPYLAALLAGENSPLDLKGFGGERIARLARLGAPSLQPLDQLSLGELAAMTWAAETVNAAAIGNAVGPRLLRLDFDDLLADPCATLARACAHLGIVANAPYLAGANESPLLRVYSKAMDLPFSPELRQEILRQSRSRHGAEISKGLAWLEALARNWPTAARALSIH